MSHVTLTPDATGADTHLMCNTWAMSRPAHKVWDVALMVLVHTSSARFPYSSRDFCAASIRSHVCCPSSNRMKYKHPLRSNDHISSNSSFTSSSVSSQGRSCRMYIEKVSTNAIQSSMNQLARYLHPTAALANNSKTSSWHEPVTCACC